MTHPDDATLQTWHDRELPPAEAVSIDAHLARCAACESRAAGLRALGDGLARWADDAPVQFDLTASILGAIAPQERAPTPPAPAKVLPLDAARARRSPGRAMLYPAFAAAAALVFFLVWHNPARLQIPIAPPPQGTTNVSARPVEVGGGQGGAEVTRVDVQGAQSYSVLQIQGVNPGAMTAVVWIQDAPEESP
jgi:hypothetical protein